MASFSYGFNANCFLSAILTGHGIRIFELDNNDYIEH